MFTTSEGSQNAAFIFLGKPLLYFADFHDIQKRLKQKFSTAPFTKVNVSDWKSRGKGVDVHQIHTAVRWVHKVETAHETSYEDLESITKLLQGDNIPDCARILVTGNELNFLSNNCPIVLSTTSNQHKVTELILDAMTLRSADLKDSQHFLQTEVMA